MSTAEDVKHPVIVLRRSKNAERKRLTALHELGHLILRFKDGIEDKEEEKPCNLFASEMLIPESEMKRILGIVRKSVAAAKLA